MKKPRAKERRRHPRKKIHVKVKILGVITSVLLFCSIAHAGIDFNMSSPVVKELDKLSERLRDDIYQPQVINALRKRFEALEDSEAKDYMLETVSIMNRIMHKDKELEKMQKILFFGNKYQKKDLHDKYLEAWREKSLLLDEVYTAYWMAKEAASSPVGAVYRMSSVPVIY